MSGQDPSAIVAKGRMGPLQIAAVFLCILLNAVDGFDVLAISFASPSIAAEWGIDRATLGIVLSMELIGMAFGSVLIGGLADRVGRRPVILGCTLVMASGMFAASHAGDVATLSAFRFYTGLGIGGMLASVNAMVAEYANDRYKHLSVTIMAAGFPIGAVVGGSVATQLLAHFGWHSVFLLGAAATLSLFPLIFFLMPESISYLARVRPKGALEKINRTLARMGHPGVTELPPRADSAPPATWGQLFSRRWLATTIALTVAYFAHIMAFYYILKWIPKIVVDMGHPPPLAGDVLVWANVGGACGAIVLGLASQRIGVRSLVVVCLLVSAVMIGIFGFGSDSLGQLSRIAAFTGFFTNAAVVGLYAIMASTLPTELRAGGTGFVIGIGRGGAALGPIIAGFLFAAGSGLLTVSVLMAFGSALAAIAVLLLPRHRETEAVI